MSLCIVYFPLQAENVTSRASTGNASVDEEGRDANVWTVTFLQSTGTNMITTSAFRRTDHAVIPPSTCVRIIPLAWSPGRLQASLSVSATLPMGLTNEVKLANRPERSIRTRKVIDTLWDCSCQCTRLAIFPQLFVTKREESPCRQGVERSSKRMKK